MLESQNIVTAYVDESGNHDLDVEKSGASNLYICVAVLVDERQLESAKAGVREISKSFFSGHEIKSSSVGSNHPRRKRLLEQVSQLDFGYFALVVDKCRLFRDSGLQYKTSFYKYLNCELYRRILTSGVRLHVVADQHGGQTFMDSFQPYLQKRGLPNLFSGFTHDFADSATEPLVQLADLIAGSLTYVYDPEKRGDHSTAFKDLLNPKQIGIGGWPLVSSSTPHQGDSDDDVWDDQLRASCISRAESFEREYLDSGNEDREMQIAVLRHLLFIKESDEFTGNDSIYADVLIQHLQDLDYPALNRQAFSSRVVGPLRDAGLVLAGSNDGYRLATSLHDIRTYLDHDLSLIEPMMARLKRAREKVRQATTNRLAILNLPGYRCLFDLMTAFENYQMSSVESGEELHFDNGGRE